MTNDDRQTRTNGNAQGPRPHQSAQDEARESDQAHTEAANADEGADPSEDIRRQNPGERTTPDLADQVGADDPHKAEKLTTAGRPEMDLDEASA
jgi:hypothetical protein